LTNKGKKAKEKKGKDILKKKKKKKNTFTALKVSSIRI